MYTFLLTVHIIISICLVLIVLIQVGHGAEMGAAFGSAGQTQFAQTPENFFGKITTYLAIAFMIFSLLLAYLSSQNTSSSLINSQNLQELIDPPQQTTVEQPAAIESEPAADQAVEQSTMPDAATGNNSDNSGQ